ncbi:MAG: threonine synthase [Streptosporangiales bacterium]|nr:threonine synthase [Streptosporangiales bacterium]
MGLWRGVIEEYRARLPVGDDTPVVTLGEGGTPLVPAPRLSERTGCEVYLKVEGANPTGSFKDRGMTVAISKALESGAEAVVCASTGNTSASAAAYATRAGLSCAVLLPRGRVALGKLTQAIAFGATLLEVEGSFDDCLRVARDLAERHPVLLANSANPDGHRLAGQKTAAYEIVDALGRAPDAHLLPVGNAGNIAAYWQGYVEYAKDGVTNLTPRLLGFQAAGAAPIVAGEVVPEPHTVATAIQVGNPASWQRALAARDESGGSIEAVTDEQILDAYHLVAAEEAVFCEPASAASVAGLLAARRSGLLEAGSLAVCTLTGNGLKDPGHAVAGRPESETIPAEVGAVAAKLGLTTA